MSFTVDAAPVVATLIVSKPVPIVRSESPAAVEPAAFSETLTESAVPDVAAVASLP